MQDIFIKTKIPLILL